jgi:hypothetical protein
MEFTSLPETYLSDAGLLNEAFLQLEKDFTQSGVSLALRLPNPFTFELLCAVLSNELRSISARSWSELQNLLYRIDISETVIANQAKIYPEKEYTLLLAELLLKREMQKVIFRKRYGKQNDESYE